MGGCGELGCGGMVLVVDCVLLCVLRVISGLVGSRVLFMPICKKVQHISQRLRQTGRLRLIGTAI